MLPDNRVSTHPGEILKEEFLGPSGITQVAFAQHIGFPLQRVNEIIRGKRGITPDTAWLFVQALGTTPQFVLYMKNFNNSLQQSDIHFLFTEMHLQYY